VVPVLSQMYPVHAFPSYLPKIILTLASHLHLGLPSDPFFSGLPTKVLYKCLISSQRATCPAYLIHFDLTTRTILC